jgi:hypothetical protein
MLRLFNLGDIWADPVQSGYYKGWNRYSRNVAKAIPVYGQIVRTMDPDSGRKFYENTK